MLRILPLEAPSSGLSHMAVKLQAKPARLSSSLKVKQFARLVAAVLFTNRPGQRIV
jgi:hypothetical protein